MKNVFFSVLVLFMLAVSMIGNVDVEAAIPNVVVSDPSYSPQRMILGVQDLETVRVSFTITNNRGDQIFYDVVATNPTNQAGNPLNVGAITISSQNNIDTVSFSVTKNPNIVAGSYNGIITVTELDAADGNPVAGSSEQKTYSIVIDTLNKRLSASGLNEDSEFEIVSEEDNIVTKELTLQNSGNVELSNLKIKLSGTFTDNIERITFKARFGSDVNALYSDIALDQALPIQNIILAPQATLPVSFQINIPQDVDLDTYSGNILFLDSNDQTLLTVPLVVKVEPTVCSDGNIGNLKLTIDSPGRNEDFRINEEISIETVVDNKDNRDMDIIVEAMLYDLNKARKIDIAESESIDVSKGDADNFDFIMKVPNKEEIDPDNTYILYIKAFEDGDENKNCAYKSVEIDLERDNDAVIMNAFTINPVVALQESSVSFRIGVENIGTDEQRDSYIVVKNDELKLNLRSNLFDLKKYDRTENDKVELFTFTIPADAVVKDYTIEAVVYYNNERDTASSFGTLTVQAKEVTTNTETTPTIGTGTTGAGTYVPTKSIFSNLDSTKTLFIIGDIILVILAILFLILIFKKR